MERHVIFAIAIATVSVVLNVAILAFVRKFQSETRRENAEWKLETWKKFNDNVSEFNDGNRKEGQCLKRDIETVKSLLDDYRKDMVKRDEDTAKAASSGHLHCQEGIKACKDGLLALEEMVNLRMESAAKGVKKASDAAKEAQRLVGKLREEIGTIGEVGEDGELMVSETYNGELGHLVTHLHTAEDSIEGLERKVRMLTEKFSGMDEAVANYAEAAQLAVKTEKDFNDGLNNLMNFTGLPVAKKG